MLAYSGHVMTLANSIIGVGILAMPFCFQKCGIILSVLLLIISNWVTRISCHYLIKSSLLTRRKSFEFLGFHAFGASGKLLAELCIIGYLFGTSITYFVVMGDLGPQIASKMFSLNAADFPHLRTWVMVVVTLFCILPLTMLKNVDSLSTVCAASIGFYVCLVVKVVLESEEHIVAHDWIEKVEYWRPNGILQCLPIFSMALSCQMQLFEVFESINNQSVEKLNGIVRNATWICTFVYIAVGFFGYVAFCTQSFSGNILLNFSPSFGSDVIKIGFVLSVAFSFPLVIFPCRASIYSLLYRKGHTDTTGYIPETRFKIITIWLVGCALCIALMIPSVELIIGLVGSTIGVAICIMFPAFCFRKIVKKDSTERSLAHFIFVSGFCLMVLGTYANLHAIDERRSGAHLHVGKEMEEANLINPTERINSMSQETAALPAPQIDKIGKENGVRDLKFKNDEFELSAQKNIEKKADLLKNVTPIQPVLPISVDDTVKKQENSIGNIIAGKEDNSFTIVSPKSQLKHEDVAPKADENVKEIEKQEVLPNLIPKAPTDLLSPQQQDIAPQLPQRLQNLQQNKQQQTIDKEAIKKDEEIAAEEYKNGQKASKGNNDVELKETRKELKKTKELLERTVDQLKQELAKQNEETQNLVAEKLEEVVQKVEQIEKKVQYNVPAEASAKDMKDIAESSPQESERELKESAAVPPKKLDISKVENQPEERLSLLDILAEQPAEMRSQKQAFEPLSYKTGELIEQVKNASKVDQRLPLPLAVLFNATNIKTQNHSSIHERALTNKSSSFSPRSGNNASASINIKTENSTQRPNVKDNVEAIRRDILQLNFESLKEFPSLSLPVSEIENDTDLAAANVPHMRGKRSNISHLKTPDFEKIESKSHGSNCMTAPKEEQLLTHGGLSNMIDFKMQNIGRELRSVNDDDEVKH